LDSIQKEFDKRRKQKYNHCKWRLRNRYGINLDPVIWLNFNNIYWNGKYQRLVLQNENNPHPLVIFEKYGLKFFGIFDTTFLVFSTFLDPESGIFGSYQWKNSNVYNYRNK